MSDDTMAERVKKTFIPPKRSCETGLAKVAKKLKKDAAKKKIGIFDGGNASGETPPTIINDKNDEKQEEQQSGKGKEDI